MSEIFDFDTHINRRGTDSVKWTWVDDDVIPMWLADMDFLSPPCVTRALQERVAQGLYGYVFDNKALREVICERMKRLYGWEVTPEQIVFTPGLVTGLNTVSRAVGVPGDGVLMQPPVYAPFLSAPQNNSRFAHFAPLAVRTEGQFLHYEIDFDVFEAAITPQTRMFFLCNPHNPVGRVYSRDELERLAQICLKHDVVICSDEIHADLLFNGRRHIPSASLSPEIANKSITLMAPSKTFNLPGLFCGFAIIPNETLRKQFETASHTAGHVNMFGFVAALAAYQEGQAWLDALLRYLQGNYDYLADTLAKRENGRLRRHLFSVVRLPRKWH